MAVEIYVHELASNTPDARVSTHVAGLATVASHLQLGTNEVCRRMKLGESLNRMVYNAMFGPGVMKVGVCSSWGKHMTDARMRYGMTFAETVDLDDLVVDMRAKSLHQQRFMGDRYTLPYSHVTESGDYENTKDLVPTYQREFNDAGDMRVSAMSHAFGAIEDEDEVVELWDIWLPRDGVIVTLPVSDTSSSVFGEPIKIVEWQGRDEGPYHWLSFHDVPSNIMPLPPVSLLRDLHDASNALLRKLIRQAERQKTIGITSASATKDAEEIKQADDGDIIRADRPKETGEVKFGGADQVTLAMFLQLRQLFSYAGGNLDAIGGLGPQSETLGQDRLISESASRRMKKMSARTVAVATEIVRDIARWEIWTNPGVAVETQRVVPGFNDVAVPVVVSQNTLRGDFTDFNFSISIHSMVDRSPEELLQFGFSFIDRLAPIWPMLAEQGISLNVESLIDFAATAVNFPELRRFFTYQNPSIPQRGMFGDSPVKPGATKRTYERISRSAATRDGTEKSMMAALVGAGGPSNKPSGQKGIGI
jgi:hypothetical protein